MFPVVIPDNMKSIVDLAEHTAPRFNDAFLEYAQEPRASSSTQRGCEPQRTSRASSGSCPTCQNNFYAGETFGDLAHCSGDGGDLVSRRRPAPGSTARPSADRSSIQDRRETLLLPAPDRGSTHRCSEPKVHRDLHVEVDKALYSVPRHYWDERCSARRDERTVRLSFRGELVKVHPRVSPGQALDVIPRTSLEHTALYATRDTKLLTRLSAARARARQSSRTPL